MSRVSPSSHVQGRLTPATPKVTHPCHVQGCLFSSSITSSLPIVSSHWLFSSFNLPIPCLTPSSFHHPFLISLLPIPFPRPFPSSLSFVLCLIFFPRPVPHTFPSASFPLVATRHEFPSRPFRSPPVIHSLPVIHPFPSSIRNHTFVKKSCDCMRAIKP